MKGRGRQLPSQPLPWAIASNIGGVVVIIGLPRPATRLFIQSESVLF